jgi:hypothetical protein
MAIGPAGGEHLDRRNRRTQNPGKQQAHQKRLDGIARAMRWQLAAETSSHRRCNCDRSRRQAEAERQRTDRTRRGGADGHQRDSRHQRPGRMGFRLGADIDAREHGNQAPRAQGKRLIPQRRRRRPTERQQDRHCDGQAHTEHQGKTKTPRCQFRRLIWP